MARLYPIVVEKVVPAGQRVIASFKADVASGDFNVRRLLGAAFLEDALNSAPAGTPLPLQSDSDTAATPMPTLQQVFYELKIGQDQQSAPLMMAAIGAFGALMFEPAALPDFPEGADIQVAFTNNTTEDLNCRIEFHGTYDN